VKRAEEARLHAAMRSRAGDDAAREQVKRWYAEEYRNRTAARARRPGG
jgi:hypothetical protein